MNPYEVVAYAVILGSLIGYALYLRARGQALEREAHELAETDTLAATEDA